MEKRKEKDESERSYRWLLFFVMDFWWLGGNLEDCFGVFWKEKRGVEMRWWGMEGLSQVSFFFFFFFFFLISVVDDHVRYHHTCTCIILS